MTANTTGWQAESKMNLTGNADEKVSLSSLSELTGFPVDFIKKELLLEKEPLSLNELRTSMMAYLESTVEELKA